MAVRLQRTRVRRLARLAWQFGAAKLHVGTTSLVLNANGTVHSEARHYPYGEERWSSGTLTTDYRFTGQRLQASLGLYSMGARFYDPALGRWTSADTLVPDPRNPQSFNRYAYVNNQPLSLVDSDGHAGTTAKLIRGAGKGYGPFAYRGFTAPASVPATTQMAREGASLTVDFVPVVGDLKGLAEVAYGKDLITGEELGAWRWAGLFGLIGLAEIRLLRHADEAGDVIRWVFKVEDTVDAVGQWHHMLPTKVMRALDEHRTLRGVFTRDDLLVRASDLASHRGYQTWHRAYDDEIVEWLANPRHAEATQKEFLQFLLKIYSRPDILERFPGAVDLLRQALEALE